MRVIHASGVERELSAAVERAGIGDIAQHIETQRGTATLDYIAAIDQIIGVNRQQALGSQRTLLGEGATGYQAGTAVALGLPDQGGIAGTG